LSEERDALERLMREYGRDVWNYVFAMVRDRHLADDLVQETFLKVYRHWRSFRGECAERTWIFRIARNAVYDYRRSAFWRKVLPVAVVARREAGPSAEQAVLERELANDAWRLVMRLPVKYREVIVLFAHHQLSLQEIADVLGISVGTVKSRLFHARRKLTEWKGGRAPDSGFRS